MAALYKADRWLENGQHLEEIVCRICSQVLASRAVLTSRVLLAGGGGRDLPAPRPPVPSHAETMRRLRRQHVAENQQPCPVVGCRQTFYASRSKSGLCEVHRRSIRWWEREVRLFIRGRRPTQPGPPAISVVNGIWINRGDPLPGIPGERPAPGVVHPKPKGRRRKRSPAAVLGVCIACREKMVPIVAWELCPGCHERYRRGELTI
jgi:hypothetical protein